MKSLTSLIEQIEKTQKLDSARDAFGLALAVLGDDEKIVVLDADVGNSTRTILFAEQHPDRFFNIGIAEQDMISISAGFASCGHIPIVAAFATFLVGRGLDQIRNMVTIGGWNVKLVGTHAGLATGEDGATHQALEDLGIMRNIPTMRVMSPADSFETVKMVEFSIKYHGPVYIRLPRATGERIHTKNYVFDPNSVDTLVSWKDKDVVIFATGFIVAHTLQAVKLLKEQGIQCGLVNIHTIKPMAKDDVIKICKNAKLIVSVEDHSIIGGLGSSLAEILSEVRTTVVLKRIGVEDRFGKTGSIEDLFDHFGLSPKKISHRIEREWSLLQQ